MTIKHHQIFQVYLPKNTTGDETEMTASMLLEEAYLLFNGEITPDFVPNDFDRNPLDVVLSPSFIFISKKRHSSESERFKFINECIDREFCQMFLSVRPVYRATEFVDYHFDRYEGDKHTFLKHMKYVILPLLRKIIEKEPSEGEIIRNDFPGFSEVSEIILSWIMEKEKTLNPQEDNKPGSRFKTTIKSAKTVVVNNDSRVEKIEQNFFKANEGRVISIIGLIISVLMLALAFWVDWDKLF